MTPSSKRRRARGTPRSGEVAAGRRLAHGADAPGRSRSPTRSAAPIPAAATGIEQAGDEPDRVLEEVRERVRVERMNVAASTSPNSPSARTAAGTAIANHTGCARWSGTWKNSQPQQASRPASRGPIAEVASASSSTEASGRDGEQHRASRPSAGAGEPPEPASVVDQIPMIPAASDTRAATRWRRAVHEVRDRRVDDRQDHVQHEEPVSVGS